MIDSIGDTIKHKVNASYDPIKFLLMCKRKFDNYPVNTKDRYIVLLCSTSNKEDIIYNECVPCGCLSEALDVKSDWLSEFKSQNNKNITGYIASIVDVPVMFNGADNNAYPRLTTNSNTPNAKTYLLFVLFPFFKFIIITLLYFIFSMSYFLFLSKSFLYYFFDFF